MDIDDNNLTFVIRCQRIINTIYDYLNTKDVGNMRLMCKRSKISATSSLLKKMNVTKRHFIIENDKDFFDKNIFVKKNKISKIRVTMFSGEFEYIDSYEHVNDVSIINGAFHTFHRIDDAFTNITTLTISCNTIEIRKLANLKDLQRLSITADFIIDIKKITLLTNLKKIRIDSQRSFIDLKQFKKCKNLTHLHMSDRTWSTHTASIESDTIIKLTLEDCNYQSITSLPPTLISFKCKNPGGFSPKLCILPPTLKHLSLGYVNHKIEGLDQCDLRSLTIKCILNTNLPKIPTSIERFNVRLRDCGLLDDVFYKDEKYINLKSLTLEFINDIKDISRFVNLRSLKVKYLSSIVAPVINNKFLTDVKILGGMISSYDFLKGVKSLRRLTIPKFNSLDICLDNKDLLIYKI